MIELSQALMDPTAWPRPVERVEHLETHISHLFLVGEHAYKVKKPLDLGFLDFSTLERRRHFCQEEVRLNGRTAPGLYLAAVPITRDEAGLHVEGEGEPVEWAVKMRRFDQAGLFDRLELDGVLMDRLAERVVGFHRSLTPAPPDRDWGRPAQVWFPMNQNFEQILELGLFPEHEARLRALWQQAEALFRRREPLVAERRAGGFVRECHGDLHLGNIALVEGEVMLFDGIEFNPDLRWIDVANDIAFLLMDLAQRGLDRLGWRFLNRYLEVTGDYEAVPLLPLYEAYRAMVRAKVAGIRLAQEGPTGTQAPALRAEFETYLRLAELQLNPTGPGALYLTHGLSGSGKSELARGLRERMGLIHLASDPERKRLHGLDPLDRSASELDGGLYTAEATERTYIRLAGLSELLLEASYGVIVDATFLDPAQRARFQALAERAGAPWRILHLEAPAEVLRRRVARRAERGDDASEADVAVLERQLEGQKPLTAEERPHVLVLDASRPWDLDAVVARLEQG